MEFLLKDKKIKELLRKHCYEVLEYLIHKKVNFSIVCNVCRVKFEPELPDSIRGSFSDLTVFILAGYTFESLELDSKNLYFEAGFGEENLGSFVTTPLDSIVQILLPNDEDLRADFCVFVNLFATFAELEQTKNGEEEGIHSSMKALLANPKNKRFKK
ncbi:MAG: hypothetical protein K2N75_07360 [Helicobacter sp.]|uniref:hypothetical protein n=1 Tax=Helicobacter sp. TaxID=218 RepID=UPI0023C6E433|nr:hypothetical protein [Helicobacter sp.]MDE7175839.1 hypothetical protein [Helicobacter sp.]